MKKINAVIIDDEGINTLTQLINKFIEEITIVGQAENVLDGIQCIDTLKPELVFLDIKLPDGTGLDILEKCKFKNFEVIFTTAYEEFALHAIERSALHYLLKPIAIPKLREAVARFKDLDKRNDLQLQIENLRNDIDNKSKKIILNSADELVLISLDDVLYLKSNGNYTHFYLSDGRDIMVSKTISHFETVLPSGSFFRVHKQFIINLKHIHSFQKGRGGYAVMSNKQSIEVSARRKLEFIEHLEKFISVS